jgi:uncharacterized protein YodC (DUF2158 family)
MRIKPGDIVELKSDGPPMTVSSFRPLDTSSLLGEKGFSQSIKEEDLEYNCKWFTGAILGKGYFRYDALEVVRNGLESKLEANIGDLVRLKSGGPKMTVAYEESSGIYVCQWFADEILYEGSFGYPALMRWGLPSLEPMLGADTAEE